MPHICWRVAIIKAWGYAEITADSDTEPVVILRIWD